MDAGVPFKRFEKLVGKLRHATIGIPAGKALFGPINRLIALHPTTIFWNRCPTVKQALNDWRQLLREASREPTHAKELVAGALAYKGMLDACKEGAGGVWIPAERSLAPTVLRYDW